MKVFVVSLKRSVDRRERIKKQLNDAGIDFTFFDAESISPEHWIYTKYNTNNAQRYKGYQLTTPELGCFASHISLWEECKTSNQTILILEDNIEIYGDIYRQLNTIDSLAQDYGVVKLGNIFKRKFKNIRHIDSNYQLISNLKGACGTSAYAISPKTARLYLNNIDDFFEPVDDFMDNEWRTKQTIYSYFPELISRSKIQSTIGKRKVKHSISFFNRVMVELYRIYKQIMQLLYNHKYKS